MSAPLPLAAFDFALPDERIAKHPARPRDSSRMMVVPRDGREARHVAFSSLPGLLKAGDVVVVNETKVIPGRLRLRRSTGGAVELLMVRALDGPMAEATRWECLGRPGTALKPGAKLLAADGTCLTVLSRAGAAAHVGGEPGVVWRLICDQGEVPLPPYIHRDGGGPSAADAHDYQTIFAAAPGAAAAPTASLHFTEAVLAAMQERGIELGRLTLHVGPGTFLPVRREHEHDVRGHQMHAERYEIPSDTLQRIEAARRRGGRVVAVGTTCVRALETWARSGETRGESSLFIYDGFQFRCVDAMITNFHLPRSTLLMLVCAFAGRQRVLDAYREAMTIGYRFYSYGDAMLLL